MSKLLNIEESKQTISKILSTLNTRKEILIQINKTYLYRINKNQFFFYNGMFYETDFIPFVFDNTSLEDGWKWPTYNPIVPALSPVNWRGYGSILIDFYNITEDIIKKLNFNLIFKDGIDNESSAGNIYLPGSIENSSVVDSGDFIFGVSDMGYYYSILSDSHIQLVIYYIIILPLSVFTTSITANYAPLPAFYWKVCLNISNEAKIY